MADITFEELLSYKVMLEKKHSPATVMKKIAALKSFFKFAKRTKAIQNNPAEEINVAGPTKDRIPTHLTVEEVHRLIKMPDRRTVLGKTPSETQANEWRQMAEELRRRGVLDKSEELFLKALDLNPLGVCPSNSFSGGTGDIIGAA